ncbi:MAG TPA: efflux RND transporter permease subunit [Vicinamibacterales bacterium]|nr:efflux RND transporter permease subunit [Vicinamibacterales bacterium]
MSIPRIAIARPVTMFMISAIIILLGLISVTRLPVDLLPDVTYPTVTVRVGYPGVGPQEIEQLITRPIEQAVGAVAGLEQINSTSQEGSSIVRLSFAWGTDLSEAMDDLRTRLDRVRGRMPEDAEALTIFRQDSNAMPIMSLGIEGNYDRVTLREMAENQIGPRLERINGVAAVTTNGGLRRQIHVQLSKEKVAALELPVERITALLRSENQNTPLGEIDQGERTYLLRSQSQFQSLDEIRNLVLMTRGGVPIYVRDVAEVLDTTEDIRSLLRINGRPGVRLSVQKQSGTNTVQVAEGIRAEIDRINLEMPNIKLNVLDDSSVYISRSINSVQEHALIGAGLVTLIIFLFLRSFRSTLIVCTSIPISVIGTFALLYFAGYTLNIMTFGGLALGIGMVVDAAIVVLENAYRHMEHGKDRVTAAIEGSEEVWGAIVASILTHIAVFVPLLFLTGISSILFKQLSVVVIFSLLMSLLVAVTLVPVLCAHLLKLPAPVDERKGLGGRLFTAGENFLEGMDDAYRRLLHKALDHRPMVVAAGVLSVVAAVLMFPLLNTELAPQTDESVVEVTAELAAGTRIERTDAIISRLEQMVQEAVPEATTIIASAGSGGMGFGGGGGTSRGRISLFLVAKDQRKRSSDQIAFDLRRYLSNVPGVIVRANSGGGNNQLNRLMSGGISNDGGRMSVEIRGEDLVAGRRIAQEVRDLLQSIPGIADPRLNREEARPEMAVMVDRPKAALFGLSTTSVAQTIRTNVAGTTAAQFRQGGYEYPIVVRLREEDRGELTDVNDVMVNTASGVALPVKNMMTIQSQLGPSQIERKNQERIVLVSAEPEIPLSEAVAAVSLRLPEVNRPQAFSVGFGAEVEQQQKTFNELRLVLILALILVYAVMASQYESLRDPFIIMFSVPTAALGVVLALYLTNTSFNLQAYLGVIMLGGIVVSNAILLVDYTNILRRRDGMEIREAVEVAGRTRLRPILMTSLATMLGLVPMALGIGEGSELQVPLARVVIGGLLTSTFITLVFVPTVYTIFEGGWSELWKKRPHHVAAH